MELELLKRNDGKDDPYLVSGNDALEIKLVREPEDILDESTSFKPDLCHQLFGESEQIYGYKDLKIKLYYAAGNLDTYVNVEYKDKINNNHLEADDLDKVLKDLLQYKFETNLSNFEKNLYNDNKFQPSGELIYSFTLQGIEHERTFEVYVNTVNDINYLNYHRRLQTFVIFYIDAANYIDIDEENWKIFVLYEKYKSKNLEIKYGLIGYASVYEYYAYPSNIRPRISQILILPRYRGEGLCSKLLNSAYRYYINDVKVLDITVESPSTDFQRVRDYVDCINCLKYEEFQAHKLIDRFSNSLAEFAREKLKLNKKQVRRVYEILRLKETNVHDKEQYKSYVYAIKERLSRPLRKRSGKRKFWCYFESDPDDNSIYVPAMTLEENTQALEIEIETDFRELKEQYEAVITRLLKYPEL